jgi:thioredoxin 1
MTNTHQDSAIVHIGDDQFESAVLGSDKPVLLDFYSDTCPPCLMMGTVLEKLAWQHRHKVTVVKMRLPDCKATAEGFEITSVPTLLFFHNGEVVQTEVGYEDYAYLRDLFDDFVAHYAGGNNVDDAQAEAEEIAFEEAVLAAETAFNAVEEPAHATLNIVYEPAADELDAALAQLAASRDDDLPSDQYEAQDQALVAAFRAKTDEAVNAYRAVVRPARQVYFDAVAEAFAAYKNDCDEK